MFSLTLAVGTHSWRLLYREEAKAIDHFNFLNTSDPGTKITLVDDFGQSAYIKIDALAGACLEDLDKSKMGLVEMALHQARTQNAAQSAAQADPSLRAMRQNVGSPILSPMGNGVRPF